MNRVHAISYLAKVARRRAAQDAARKVEEHEQRAFAKQQKIKHVPRWSILKRRGLFLVLDHRRLIRGTFNIRSAAVKMIRDNGAKRVKRRV